uniref:Uncharacterized protein n=1 Tax=Rhizophora mucronata TaxID=61149 RepID=A0A2P2QW49_RHIMU
MKFQCLLSVGLELGILKLIKTLFELHFGSLFFVGFNVLHFIFGGVCGIPSLL